MRQRGQSSSAYSTYSQKGVLRNHVLHEISIYCMFRVFLLTLEKVYDRRRTMTPLSTYAA